MESKYRGILCIIVSAFGFACMNLCIRLSGDLPTFQKLVFRNLIAAILAFSTIMVRHKRVQLEKRDLPLLLLRSVLGVSAMFCNFYAVDHLFLGDATMLSKLAPFSTLLFSYLFLKERISLKQVLLVIGAFCGSLFIIKPSGFSNSSFLPSFIGLCGGVGAGAAYTALRALGRRNVDGPSIILFFSLFSLLGCLPFAISVWRPMAFSQVAALLGAGCFATVGQWGITYAYRYAPSREISIYDYTQVVFAAVLGFIFFGQVPDLLSFAGYFVIFMMALGMFLETKRG